MNIFYIPFGYVMKACLWVGQNYYWIAIILFSLIMELVLLPLSIKQQKSSIKQATLRPKEIAIKRKYKNRTDREAQQQMNMEIQTMYQQNGHNTFAGCLPLLIQLPIIFILYAIVREPLQYNLFLEKEQINDAYTYSIQLTDVIKDELNAELSVLNEIDGDKLTEEQKEKKEFIKLKLEELSKNQTQMCDFYHKDGDEISYYMEGDENIPDDTSKGVKTEYHVVSLTKHFDMDFREELEEYGLCKELLSKDTETILKEAYHYEENPDLYEKLMKLPDYSFIGSSLLKTPSIKKIDWMVIIPILVFLTSFLSAKVSRKLQPQNLDADGKPTEMPGGKMMEWMMPLMSLFFAFSFQAALGIYWIWRSVFSMGKQVLLAKVYPIPSYTEEEIRQAIKELNKNTKKKKKIVIEVDEDDHSYDNLKVSDSPSESGKTASGGTRRIKMLSADDDDDVAPAPDVTETDSVSE